MTSSRAADSGDVSNLVARPTWHRLAECPRCVLQRPNLVRTGITALVVGTVLFLINHLGLVLDGHAGTAVWVETGLSFLVPFCVANIGLLVAGRRDEPFDHATSARPRAAAAPTWSRLSECPRCITHRPHLLRTSSIAILVGTLLFGINQLDAVAGGHATTRVWIASGLTYLVPLSVSNIGVLVGCRRTEP